jgi:hypothetical protein
MRSRTRNSLVIGLGVCAAGAAFAGLDGHPTGLFAGAAALASAAAWWAERRSPWPWALILAAATIAVVTDWSAVGIAAGDVNEFAAAFTAPVMALVMFIAASVGVFRVWAHESDSLSDGWALTPVLCAGIVTVCAVASLVVDAADAAYAVGLFAAAVATATAAHRHSPVWPWVVVFVASATAIGAHYPATAPYYDHDAPAAQFANSDSPGHVLAVATIVTLASVGAWALMTRGRTPDGKVSAP